MNAKFLNLNLSDFTKGLIVTVLTALVIGLEQILQSGTLPTLLQWKVIGLSALSAGVGYLLKNLLTNSKDQFLSVEPKEPPTVVSK